MSRPFGSKDRQPRRRGPRTEHETPTRVRDDGYEAQLFEKRVRVLHTWLPATVDHVPMVWRILGGHGVPLR